MALAEDRLDLEETEQAQEPEFGSAMKVKKRNGDFDAFSHQKDRSKWLKQMFCP